MTTLLARPGSAVAKAASPAPALPLSTLRPFASALRRLRASGIDAAVRSHAGDGVAEERIDVIELGDRRALFTIVDAKGREDLAARLVAHVRGRTSMLGHPPALDAILRSADAVVRGEGREPGLASMVLLLVDGPRHSVRCANAGMPLPLVGGRAGFVAPLGERGPSLGLGVEVRRAETFPVRLSPEQVLLACSDGVISAPDAAGVEFGPDRAADALAESRGEGARAVARETFRRVLQWTGPFESDDRTLLAIRLKPRAA